MKTRPQSKSIFKFLLGLFSIAFYSFNVSAAIEYTTTGVARLRFEDSMSYGAAVNSFQRSAFWSIRIRPTVQVKVDERASLYVEPQFAKVLGRDYSYTQTDSSGTSVYNEPVQMHQGYINIKVADGLNLKGGRLALEYGSGTVIGKSDWGVFGRAFDGVLIVADMPLVKTDIAHLKIDSTANTIDADKELALLYSQWTLSEQLRVFDLYGFYESDRTAGRNESRYVLGSRAKLKLDDADFGVEHAQEGLMGQMLIADIGYSWAEFAKLRLGIEFDQANEHWVEWYQTSKSALGRNDLVGRKNLTAIALRAKFEPVDNLAVQFDVWSFSRTNSAASAYKSNGSAIGTSSASTSLAIGQSIEVAATYKATERVDYGLGVAYFIQGPYLKDQFGDRAMTDGYALVNVTF